MEIGSSAAVECPTFALNKGAVTGVSSVHDGLHPPGKQSSKMTCSSLIQEHILARLSELQTHMDVTLCSGDSLKLESVFE